VTVAVCLRCGEYKHGAFNRCRSCGYTPDDDESLTKHLLVTDHFHSRESLAAIAARVKAGEPVEFDPQTLQQAWVSKAALDAESERLRRGCLIGCGVLLALAVAAGVIAVVWRPG
jgi:hypothetical protein